MRYQEHDHAIDELVDYIMNHQMAHVAEEILSEARVAAPYRTGRLKRSFVRIREHTTWWIGAVAPYAIFVELGTRFMKGRFYLRQALYRLRVIR